ncbi:hypothetical protein ARZXY2_4435 (plasmid) [Arthrobacter sp. ZXY-2]|nr:hypothetical protein ARZXY2_4435 [Arthrobacter sp. ZXY-2]
MPHQWFGILVQGREAVPDLFQSGERELLADPVPKLLRDGEW